MSALYTIANPDDVLSPGLVVFEEILRENVARMIEIAGDAGRLRPHCKTHKMIDITRLEVGMGIVKHKCATFAEAEMLALGGARDVFLAYNVVGPNVERAVRYRQRFPEVRFSVAADHPEPVDALNDALAHAGERVNVFVDIDTGLRRTGTPARARGARPVREDRRFEPSDSGRAARVRRAEPPERPRRSATRRRPGLGRGPRAPRAARGHVAGRPRDRRGRHRLLSGVCRQGRPGAGAEPRNLRLPRRPLHAGVPGHGVRGRRRSSSRGS